MTKNPGLVLCESLPSTSQGFKTLCGRKRTYIHTSDAEQPQKQWTSGLGAPDRTTRSLRKKKSLLIRVFGKVLRSSLSSGLNGRLKGYCFRKKTVNRLTKIQTTTIDGVCRSRSAVWPVNCLVYCLASTSGGYNWSWWCFVYYSQLNRTMRSFRPMLSLNGMWARLSVWFIVCVET